MALRKGFARLVAAVGLFAIVTSIGLLAGPSAHAQPALPFLAYGVGQTAGDTVTANLAGAACGTGTVDAAGQWSISITADATCTVTAGDTINFALNGTAVTETAVFGVGDNVGNGQYPVATGMTLTAGAAAAPAPAAPAAAPAPADTGNAGLATEAGTSLWFAMALGALALATLAGARVSTGREQR